MDFLRYCYTADSQFGTDPNNTRRIRWYRCAPGAKPIGFPHHFGSEVWYGGDPYEGVGERPHLASDWWNGVFPVFVAGTGSPCGSIQVFKNGWPGPVPMTLPRYFSGLAKCCGIFPDWDGPNLHRRRQIHRDDAQPPPRRVRVAAFTAAAPIIAKSRNRLQQPTPVRATVTRPAAPPPSGQWVRRRFDGRDERPSAPGARARRLAAAPAAPAVSRRSERGQELLAAPRARARRVAAATSVSAVAPRLDRATILVAGFSARSSTFATAVRSHVQQRTKLDIAEAVHFDPKFVRKSSVVTRATPKFGQRALGFQTGTNTLTITFTSATFAGSTLVLGVTVVGATASNPTGFGAPVSTTALGAGGTLYRFEWYNAPSQTSITINFSAICAGSASCAEIQNAATSPLDQTTTPATGTGTSAASNTTGSVTNIPEIGVCVLGVAGQATPSSYSNGYTDVGFTGSTTTGVGIATKQLTSSGTTQTTATLGLFATWAITLRTFT